MRQGPLLYFESSAFPVADGEDKETNPGIFGKALAKWLSGKLNERGINTTGVIAEDFGWCVGVASEPHKLYVACSNADGQKTSWQLFVFVEGGVLNRILGKDKSAEALNELHLSVRDILATDPSVMELREQDDN